MLNILHPSPLLEGSINLQFGGFSHKFEIYEALLRLRFYELYNISVFTATHPVKYT